MGIILQRIDGYKEIIEQEYLERIFGYAFNKTGRRQDAEELAQEIIVEIYSALETVEEINNFPAWVWSIARYTFYKWLGKQKKNASIEIIGPIAHEEDVVKKAIQKDELNRLRREISFLSERYRKIIILHYFENKSCKEIAELLSIPPGTVKWYLYDARKK